MQAKHVHVRCFTINGNNNLQIVFQPTINITFENPNIDRLQNGMVPHECEQENLLNIHSNAIYSLIHKYLEKHKDNEYSDESLMGMIYSLVQMFYSNEKTPDHINIMDDDPLSNHHKVFSGKKFIKDEKSWHKNDDRNCEDDIEKNCYSLFCALQRASIEFEGEYNHRNAIMQKIRQTIVKIYPSKEWKHRLRDFNNMPETDFDILMELLNRVESEVVIELEQKK